MKKMLILLLIASIWSCTGPQEPVFLRLQDVKVTKISTRNITITGEALFHNPNAIGGTLVSTDIDVISNDVVIAQIAQEQATKLPTQAEFSIPLSFNTSPKELFDKNGKGVLGGVINALLDRTVKLQYKGKVKFKIAGLPFETPIEFEEEVELKN